MARRLVIIGGDAAGMSAAAQARRMTAAGEAGGTIVDDHLRTVTPHVWAAGDLGDSYHRIIGRSVVVALATHANKQGRVAGTNIAGGDAAVAGVLGTAITNSETWRSVAPGSPKRRPGPRGSTQ